MTEATGGFLDKLSVPIRENARIFWKNKFFPFAILGLFHSQEYAIIIVSCSHATDLLLYACLGRLGSESLDQDPSAATRDHTYPIACLDCLANATPFPPYLHGNKRIMTPGACQWSRHTWVVHVICEYTQAELHW